MEKKTGKVNQDYAALAQCRLFIKLTKNRL